MKLANNVDLYIQINGHELPLERFSRLEMQIDGADDLGLPILNMLITDSLGGVLLEQFYPLNDSALITIRFSSGSDTITREFRHSFSERASRSSVMIRGYLNHPHYIIQTSTHTFRGSSREALAKICERVGLHPDLVQTSDSQCWSQATKSWLNFARDIMMAAYRNDNSVLTGRVTTDGRMRSIDLSELPESKGLFGFGTGAVPIIAFKPKSVAGENLHGGYKTKMVRPDMLKPQTRDFMDVPNVQELNQHPRMGKEVQDSSVQVLPLVHPANTHDNYLTARYNNTRGLKLWSLAAALVHTQMSSLDALDLIQVSNHSETDASSAGIVGANFDGEWLISSKSIFVTSDLQYAERYSLIRSGLNIPINRDAT